MKKIDLVIAQSSKEFEYILSKIHKDLTLVPVSLEAILYCIKNKKNYLDPQFFLKNELHETAITQSKKLLDNLKYDESMSETIKIRYKGMIRKFFNSSFFIYKLITEIKKKYDINEIFVTGWNRRDPIPKKEIFVSKICLEIFGSKLVKMVDNYENYNNDESFYKYKLEKKEKIPNNSILITNLGYNFKRIILCALKSKLRVVCLSFEKISKIKKYILNILGVKFYNFKKIPTLERILQLNIPDISYIYEKKDFSNLLNYRKKQIIPELLNLHSQCDGILEFLSKNKPALILINVVRGYNGYCAKLAKESNIPSVCISHGTIASGYNSSDKIYQNIIAEEVFSGDSNYFALQSKIASKSLSTVPIHGKAIETGNLIFSEIKQKSKKYILYAVTNREFDNMHYFGVETFYEYLKNLYLFNTMAKKYNLNFLIKVHPGINHCFDDLKFIFNNLKFTKMKIEKALQISKATISYSSTVIEDSLYSKIPVILFDQWNRYMHCDAEKNSKTKNCPVYYVTNEVDLLNTINSIDESTRINFKDYIYEGSYKENFVKNIFSLANV